MSLFRKYRGAFVVVVLVAVAGIVLFQFLDDGVFSPVTNGGPEAATMDDALAPVDAAE